MPKENLNKRVDSIVSGGEADNTRDAAWQVVVEECRKLGLTLGNEFTGIENVIFFIRDLHKKAKVARKSKRKKHA